MMRADTEISKELCRFRVLKIMITLLAKSFVEKLMVKPSPTPPSCIRIQKHQMIIMEDQIVSNVRLRSIAKHCRLFVNELFDHIRRAQNNDSLRS